MQAIKDWLSNLNLAALSKADQYVPLLQAALLIGAGFLLARLARFTINRTFVSLTAQQRLLLRRGVSYAIFLLFFISGLKELGFDFSVLLGAAGIVTLAVGFASQTSVSNIISGLFLVMERSVEVGDIITVNGRTGEVLTVDLLSTKLRTFDNLLVRIPNETMVKAEIVNLNRFPIRRIDVKLGVAYKEDLRKVKETLLGVADRNPLCLEEPTPLIIAQGFGESAINFQFSVWATKENYLELLNSIHEDIKRSFDAAHIEIPFPHRTLYAGSAGEGFPVRIIHESQKHESL